MKLWGVELNTVLVTGAAAAGGNNILMIVAFLLLIGFTYFTMLRPQKKQNQQRLEMIKSLNKGDHVVMISGLHGKIDEIDDVNHTIVLDADGIYLTFNTVSVRNVIPAATASAAPVDSAADVKDDAPELKEVAPKDVTAEETAADSIEATKEAEVPAEPTAEPTPEPKEETEDTEK